MIDDKIIDIIEKIKISCENVSDCKYCIICDEYGNCSIVDVIRKLNDELSIEPIYWNINKIKKILRDEQ